MANLAVIKLAGAQHVVRAGDKFEVNRLENALDKAFTPEVLLSTNGDEVLFNDGKVEVRVIEEKKGDKLRVVKFKAKARYLKTRGHRQHLSLVEVVTINGEAKKAQTTTKDSEVAEAKEVKETAKPTVKKTAVKKTVKKTEK